MRFKWFLRIFSAACVLGLLVAAIPITPALAAPGNLAWTGGTSSGPPGAYINITGTGFTSGNTVTVTFNGTPIWGPIAITGTGFVAYVAMPSGTTPGVYPVTATASGDTCNVLYFTVTSSFTLSAASGYVGDAVTVSGSGFTPGPVTFYWDGVALASITADGSGNITAGTLPIPPATRGTHFFSTTSSAARPSFYVYSKIVLVPSSGFVGDTVVVTGSGFAAGPVNPVAISVDGASVTATSPSSINTNTTGGFTCSFSMPSVVRGSRTVRATDAGGYAETTFNVGSKITLSPTSGGVGDTIVVTGSGFAVGPVNPVVISVDGVNVTATSPSPVNTNTSGGFTCSFSMPSGTLGSRTVQATDGGGYYARATFIIGQRISITPATGFVGDNVIISGNGFAANQTIHFTLDGVAITVSPSVVTSSPTGAFSNVSFVIPSVGGGAHVLRATDQDGNYYDTTLTVQTRISITPTNGTVGTQITLTGSGFAQGLGVDVFWDASTTRITTTTATSTGTISVTFASPAGAKGNHTVKAQDTSANSATASFSTTPKIVLTPTSGSYGDTITVTFTGFTANSTVTSASILSGTTQYSLTTTPATVSIDANGSGSATFSVSNVYNGNWTVQASDSSGGSAQATLAVTQKITLTTTTGAAGDNIGIIGTGFAAGKSITLKYNGVALATSPATVTSDTNGAFPCGFTVPETAAGTIALTASDGTNVATLNFTATAKATISKATTQSAPGYVGMDITISGTGFQSNPTITVTFDSTAITGATITSGANGSFTATFNIPTAPAGNHVIHVTDGTTTKDFVFFMDSSAPAAPALLMPINKFKPKQPVPFSWNAVTDPSGVTYTFQISQDPAFGTLVLEHTGLTATTYTMTAAEKLASAGSKMPYYWRVRATDAAGNVGAWSTSNTFTIGFIWPWWMIHVWYGLGIVLALIIGLWLGRRMAYQSY